MKELASLMFSRVFLIGLCIKLLAVVFIAPQAVDIWYAPFMEASIKDFSIFPWTLWLKNGGSLEAFPYGYVMWLVLLPTASLSLFGAPISLGYDLTLLAADISILVGLLRLFEGRSKLIFWSYWMSPVILMSTYGLGLNDIIPSAFLVWSLCALKKRRHKISGGLIAAAISAKLSMIIALPFMILYLFNNKRFKRFFPTFMIAFSSVFIPLVLMHFASPAIRYMILGNQEILKVTDLNFNLGEGLLIYIVPLVYMLFLYVYWRIRQTNFDLLLASIAISFLLIVLLTAASPGWFVWAMPFLAIYVARSGGVSAIILGLFSVLYVVSIVIRVPTIWSDNFFLFVLSEHVFSNGQDLFYASSLQTLLTVVGAILMVRMWRQSFQENDFFRLTRKSVVIGVAGDSGSGKDTLVNSLVSLFGKYSSTVLLGDDYHVWDRRSSVWGAISHLNPSANDLERMSTDLVSLVNKRNVFVRHYDHQIGRFTAPLLIRPNNFICVNGLHSLYPELIRSVYDLKIYMDMDEELRRFLKIRRDTKFRGHPLEKVTQSIERRVPDAISFIHPQKQYADLVVRLEPVDRTQLSDFASDVEPSLRVTFKSTKSNNYLQLSRIFVGVLGLSVSYSNSIDGIGVEMTVDGSPTAEDIGLAAAYIFKRELELLDPMPDWQSGVQGIIQIVSLSEISRALTQRIIE